MSGQLIHVCPSIAAVACSPSVIILGTIFSFAGTVTIGIPIASVPTAKSSYAAGGVGGVDSSVGYEGGGYSYVSMVSGLQ